jgi:hypothetical protein
MEEQIKRQMNLVSNIMIILFLIALIGSSFLNSKKVDKGTRLEPRVRQPAAIV